MNSRAADLDQALRAAAGIADADVPRLPRAVIAELAADSVESIAWTFADAPVPAAVPTDRPEALLGAAETAAPPVRGPAAWLSAAVHRSLATRGRRRVAFAAALAVVAATGAAVAVSTGEKMAGTSALARWQAVPFPAPDAAAQKAAAACISEVEPHGGGRPQLGLKLSDSLLSEQRGGTVFTVLANGTSFADCLILDGRDGGAAAWSTPHGYPRPSATGISLGENSSNETTDSDNKRVDTVMLAGFAGSAVTGITVLRADGVVVTASMNDGLWGAWWPGTSKAVSFTVHTRDGSTVVLPFAKVAAASRFNASS